MVDTGQRLQIIFVETPTAGSPKTVRDTKPPNYPRNSREAWRPRTKPPSKAERLQRFLEDMHRNEEAARSMMKPDISALKAQYGV